MAEAERTGAALRGIRRALYQVAGTVAVLLIALEIWARLFPPVDMNVWPLVNIPGVGVTFQPNARVVLTNGLDFHVEERSNEVGFLDRPLPPVDKPARTCRIAIIGDSFVEAAQVPIRQKVQVELQRLMQARWPGMAVETMAVGFSGTGQLNQLGYLDAYVRPRRPDLIVNVFVSNDFANNSSVLESIRVGWHPAHTPRFFARESAAGSEIQPIDPDWSRYRLPAAKDERPFLHARLHRLSRFYRWLYAKLSLQYPGIAASIGREPSEADRTAARIEGLARLAPDAARLLEGWDPRKSPGIDAMFDQPDPLPPAFAQAERFTGFAFDQFMSRGSADGAKLFVLGTHELTGAIERRALKLLQARGIPFVSLRDHIARKNGRIADAHWRHDGHWTPQGHSWAAEALLERIAAERVCGVE